MYTALQPIRLPAVLSVENAENPSGALQSAPRTHDEKDSEESSEETLESSTQQPQPETESESEPEREPLKNRLPPLPERPTAGKRRASKAASGSFSKKDESTDAKSADSVGASSASMDSASTGVDDGVADGELPARDYRS